MGGGSRQVRWEAMQARAGSSNIDRDAYTGKADHPAQPVGPTAGRPQGSEAEAVALPFLVAINLQSS